jgi:hypothetical protein
MPPALATHEEVPTRRGERRHLVAGIFVPPLAWLAHLQANYAIASWACRPGHRYVSLLVVVVAFLITALAGRLAWKSWPREEPAAGEPQRIEGARLLALLAAGSTLSFLVVLVASAIPIFILRACD